MKAGGAYLPLDPEYPAQRLSFMIGDSGAGLVVSTAGLMDRVSLSDIDDAVGVIDMEDTLLELRLSLLSEDEIDQGELSSPLQPDHLAYLIYTSGSTGTPKGAAVTHETAVNLGYSQIAAFGLAREDRILQFASPSFDASISELLLAFGSGAGLVLLPDAVRRDAAAKLPEYMRRFGV